MVVQQKQKVHGERIVEILIRSLDGMIYLEYYANIFMMAKEHEGSELISEQLKEIHQKNNEKIQFIKSQVDVEVPCFTTHYQSQQFILTRYGSMKVRELIQNWKIDKTQLPEDPDPDKLLFGEQKELMNMTCKTFEDLVRLNNQYSVGLKYTNLLRENAAVAFGNKFKKNLEIVSELLSDLEISITKPKNEEELAPLINEINLRIAQVHSFNNVNQPQPIEDYEEEDF